ncbi:MAG: hypothetical protein ACTHN5_05165 [Phycisphaerae bacterium]
MTQAALKKPADHPAAPIKPRDGLTPMAVAKLAQARIKTLADIKRLSDDQLKALPLGIAEYNAIKKYASSLSFEEPAAPAPQPVAS